MEQLLSRARDGDDNAENELFRCLLDRFRLLAGRRIRVKEEADEVAQKACVVILEKYRNEHYEHSFEAWAYGVLRNTIRRHWQQTAQQRERFATEQSADGAGPEATSPELRMRLIACLDLMIAQKSRYARVLVLIYQGYSASEISKRLETTRNNLYVILNRARSQLKQCLETGRL